MSEQLAGASTLVAGVDEAGRGPLAGPVVAAAVILSPTQPLRGIDDSKKLTAARRELLDAGIRSRALCWALGMATVSEIDSMNIHHATLRAMRRAVLGLRYCPELVLVDGRFTPELGAIPARAEIGGDGRIEAIAAASILAKQARDTIMRCLHLSYPQYGFDIHKGYPTPGHRLAIQRFGVSECHRRSYAPVRSALEAAGEAW